MTEKDKGNYPGKHQPGEQPNETIKSVIEKKTKSREIPCAVPFAIAEKTGAPVAAEYA